FTADSLPSATSLLVVWSSVHPSQENPTIMMPAAPRTLPQNIGLIHTGIRNVRHPSRAALLTDPMYHSLAAAAQTVVDQGPVRSAGRLPPRRARARGTMGGLSGGGRRCARRSAVGPRPAAVAEATDATGAAY